MQKLIVVSILLLTGFSLPAQNDAMHSGYFLNPYLYNPAEAVTTRSSLQLTHRQQWMGFNSAPKITAATFTTMLDNSRSGIGLRASCFTRGVLKTTDYLFTYAYALPITSENIFYMAVSGGAIANYIDITDIDTSDPAIHDYLENNLQPVGNFGVLLRTASGLNLGVSLPRIFAPKYTGSRHFESRQASPTDEMVFSAYFRRKLDKKDRAYRYRKGKTNPKAERYAPLELYTLYRLSKEQGGQGEIMAKLSVGDPCWFAAGFRQYDGFIGSLGFNITPSMILSYSYQPGNAMEGSYAPDSHEVQLGFRLGKLKSLRKPAPVLQSTLQTTQPAQHTARFQESMRPTEDAMGKRYLVVVKAFNDFTTADNYRGELRKQKFNAEVYFHKKDKRFYVYLMSSVKSSDAYQEARNLRNYTKLRGATVLIVEKQASE